jgi:hypothetical protein
MYLLTLAVTLLLFALVCLNNVHAQVPSSSPTNDPTSNPSFLPSQVPSLTPSNAPSVKPTSTPTINPSRKPTRKPTAKPIHIYGENPAVFLGEKEQKSLVGVLMLLIFVAMALEIYSPEVIFLIALMIVTGCQIIQLKDALAGIVSRLERYI